MSVVSTRTVSGFPPIVAWVVETPTVVRTAASAPPIGLPSSVWTPNRRAPGPALASFISRRRPTSPFSR